MGQVAVLAAVLAGTVLAVRLLARARWTWRLPRVAILSWQALGLAIGLALIGVPLAFGLAPYGGPTASAATRLVGDLVRGDLPPALGPVRLAAVAVGVAVAARLLWVTGASALEVVRDRRRHRDLLTLVGRRDPAVPGALVLDHPTAAAYCLPGLRPTVVVSAGALALLRRAELDAVLSHERAHAVERHDIVLLPFLALTRALPPLGWLLAASEAVELLVEMRADDRARRRHPEAWLAAALHRFAGTPLASAPAGALGITGAGEAAVSSALPLDPALAARLQRLTQRRRPPRVRGTLTLASAALLAGAPAVLFTVPLLPG